VASVWPASTTPKPWSLVCGRSRAAKTSRSRSATSPRRGSRESSRSSTWCSTPRGQTIIPIRADPEGISFDVYDVVTQQFSSQHFVFAGGAVEAYPVAFRYAWPAELDLMARLAGLTLENRWAGWQGEPFTSLSRAHVSVYEKP
jgi:hypothetical protein